MGDMRPVPAMSRAREAVLRMAALGYGKDFASSEELDFYLTGLTGLSEDDIVAACAEAPKHERFWPRVAVLRGYAPQRARGEGVPAAFRVPEMWPNPDTGQLEVMFRCRDCQDTGWVQAGPPKRRGIEAHVLAGYSSVRKCTCGRLAQSKTERAQQEARES